MLQRTRLVTSPYDDQSKQVNNHLLGLDVSLTQVISVQETMFEENQSTEYSSIGCTKISIVIWYRD